MVDYAEALGYPSKNWTNVIIGGVMLILSFLIIPAFLLVGYLVEVTRSTIKGEKKQPEWNNWGKLFMNGLSVVIITIIYMIVPLIVVGFGFATSAPAMVSIMSTYGISFSELISSPTTSISTIMTSAPLLLPTLIISVGIYMALALVLTLVIGFIMPMAFSNYAAKGKIGAAFAFGEIWSRITSIFSDYLITYLVIIVMGMLFSAISGMLIFTVVLPMFVMFYNQVFVWRVQGVLYSKSKA